MRRIIYIAFFLLPGIVLAAGGGESFPHDKAPINLDNKASLQRGAKLFVNYCMGCHSLAYQRYNRLAKDTDLTDELVAANLIFTADTKIGDTMSIAMTKEDGKNWFGAAPPDLTLIARSRGVDYLYNYLRGFYLDESRPYGVNNSIFPMVAMPDVLWQLQGLQKPVYETVEGKQVITGFELLEPGSMTADEYDSAMADLVNFLAYVGEPVQQERKALGFWVLLYLILALAVFYLLKLEYWKDVH
jgi:ubiquinol-cytochrome c reductase cytochrome c1 subunit